MKTNNTTGISNQLTTLNNKFEKYQTNPKDSLLTRLGKIVKKLISSDYKSIKSELVSELKKYNEVPKSIKDRKVKNISGDDIKNAIAIIIKAKNEESKSSHIYHELIEKPPEDANNTEDTASIASDIEFPAVDFTQIAKDSFDKLQKESINIHKITDLYSRNEVFGGMRFRDIRPPKHSAVNVSVNNQPEPINANFIGENYIATQGPMTQKANADSIPAFFSMAMEQDSDTIVNLTNHNDASSSRSLQVEYWPDQGNSISHTIGSEQLSVTTENIEPYDGYKVVTLQLKKEKPRENPEPVYDNVKSPSHSESTKKTVKVFHFTEWPDHGVPTGDSLKKFNQFTKVLEENGHGKKIIHCKAGVGRTGTLIVLEQLKQGIRSGQITQDSLTESIEDLVMAGRKDRGKAFVQNSQQLQMLFELGSDELEKVNSPQPYTLTENIQNLRLSDVKNLLTEGKITNEDKQLRIEKQQWQDILKNLTTVELKQLVLTSNSVLSLNSGYHINVIKPAIEIYAAKRVPELIKDKGGIKNTRSHIDTNYKKNQILKKAALNELKKYSDN